MKKSLIVALLYLFGCSINAQSNQKPTGELVLASLFESADIKLSKEPMCNMVSASMNKSSLRLRDHLATALSSSFESKNKTTISTTCNESKHELKKGKLMDVWDCTLLINEMTPDEGFISSSTITFSLNKHNLKFVKKSLRCF